MITKNRTASYMSALCQNLNKLYNETCHGYITYSSLLTTTVMKIW